MNPAEVLVPVIFFLVIGGAIGLMLLTRHKERMILIEKGLHADEIKALYERNKPRPLNPLSSLKWGLILVCIGFAVILGMYLHTTYNVEGGVYPGLMALFGGVGLILFYLLARKKVIE